MLSAAGGGGDNANRCLHSCNANVCKIYAKLCKTTQDYASEEKHRICCIWFFITVTIRLKNVIIIESISRWMGDDLWLHKFFH